ncbi:MAG TPA: GNAT family N-acetyltransferase [Pseudonocardiaceae bacterium]|nr:GNAT family N-acetyltransferase [Pseudonocardiaceae bacterium]
MTRWPVRRATPQDAGRIAEIRVASWRHAYRDILPADGLAAMRADAAVQRWAEAAAEPPPIGLFVAVDADDVPVAYSLVGAAREDVDLHPHLPTGELWAIYADPAAIGSGAGHAVHEAGMDHLVRQGFRHAVLWVFEANGGSRRFYERHGWQPDGGREDFEWSGSVTVEVRYAKSLAQPNSV